jgi:hypothetical protein
MKKFLIVLAILVPVVVLAQGLPRLFIDGDNGSIVSKSGTQLKLGSEGSQGMAIGVSGTTEVVLDNTNLTLATNDIALTAGTVKFPVAVATAAATPGATPLPNAGVLVVTGTDGSKGIRLPDKGVGSYVTIVGYAATPAAINVYPPSGQVINGLAADALIPCAAGANCVCTKTAASATPAANTWACSLN